MYPQLPELRSAPYTVDKLAAGIILILFPYLYVQIRSYIFIFPTIWIANTTEKLSFDTFDVFISI